MRAVEKGCKFLASKNESDMDFFLRIFKSINENTDSTLQNDTRSFFFLRCTQRNRPGARAVMRRLEEPWADQIGRSLNKRFPDR